jgi:hypothetical protein
VSALSLRVARRILTWLIRLALLAGALLATLSFVRRHPEDMPWTQVDLTRPIGLFTGRKLVQLRTDPPLCRQLMSQAGISYSVLPPHEGGPNCSYADALRLGDDGSLTTRLRPAAAAMSCPVAAALALWEWQIVQPAARRHFGRAVAEIEHFGTYSCRRINGREQGEWSEHATANALDIAAFKLEGGRRISIVGDWRGDAAEAAFLREVRDGACRVFSTVLSPDYNEAHRDHLHLDQARRGAVGGRACR